MARSISSRLQSYLRGLARNRKSSTVTADDARRFLARVGVPTDEVTRHTNAVLNDSNPMFDKGQFVQSTRPAARGRQIREWQLVQ